MVMLSESNDLIDKEALKSAESILNRAPMVLPVVQAGMR